MSSWAAITPQKALGALCGLLLVGGAIAAWAPLPGVVAPERGPDPRPQLQHPPAVFVAPPSSAFDAINERPIFSPDRTPIAPTAAASGGATATPPPVSLVGVILDSKTRMALIKSAASPLETAFAIGESIDGWQVAEIDSDKVVLRSGATTDEIKLEANRAAKSTSASPGFAARPQMPGVNPQSSSQTATPTTAQQSPTGQSPVPPPSQ